MSGDRGIFTVAGDDPRDALQKGTIELRLHGKKLKSDWTLVRMKSDDGHGKEPWLLIKTGESIPAFSARSDDRSAVSARSMKGIARAGDKVWKR